MAERVQLIFAENPGSLAAEYQLPPGLDLVLSSVVARFDGAAAAASFIPVLEVLSQDDKLMARVRPDQEFAVGDTGVVTFAPFLRRAAAAAAGGAVLDAAYMIRTTNLAIANATPTVITAYDTGAADGSTLSVDLVNGIIALSATGLYLTWFDVTYTTTWGAGTTIARIAAVDQTEAAFFGAEDNRIGNIGGLASPQIGSLRLVTALGADNSWAGLLVQNSGVARTADTIAFRAVRLAALPT